MSKLFDEKLTPHSDKITEIRRCNPEYLDCIEALWEKFEPFAPKSFKKNFLKDTGKFDGLLWEMILGVNLIHQGIKLISDNSHDGDRPDLCIEIAGERLWIECYVATLGNPNSKNYPMSSPNEDGIRGVNTEALLLRCTQALKSKKEQHDKWVKKGICKENEPYIIAINGHSLRSLYIDDRSLPQIMGAVYEMGPLRVEFDPLSGDTRSFFEHRPTTKKNNNAEVTFGFFLDGRNENVSGVIYSKDWIHSYSSIKMPKYCYIENTNARNRSSLDCINFMQSYDYTKDTIRMKA